MRIVPVIAIVCTLGILNVFSAGLAAEAEDASEVERILALSQDVAYGEYLSGECVACHSVTNSTDNAVPVIHGIEASRIVNALLQFRSGERSNTTMESVAGALGDEEIAVLAYYLSTYYQKEEVQ